MLDFNPLLLNKFYSETRQIYKLIIKFKNVDFCRSVCGEICKSLVKLVHIIVSEGNVSVIPLEGVQLSLFQTEGQIMPDTVLLAHPDLKT